MRERRRVWVAGSALAAATLLLASTAYACTVFRGRMTVTAGAGTSEAVGDNTGMGHCQSPAPTQGATVTPTGSFTVSLAPASTCLSGGTNQLEDGEYTVNYFPRDNATSGAADCMNPTVIGGDGIQVTSATLTVTSGSTGGAKTVTPEVPILGPPGQLISICVTSVPQLIGGSTQPSLAQGMLVNVGFTL